jgi:pimeloyl-ACP methyl ester carboxylesterase
MAKFAFIHGAGDVGWYWHLVEAELRAHGHDTVAPDLPIEDDKAGLTEYATAVVEAIQGRRDVVVVAQSLGGYTAPDRGRSNRCHAHRSRRRNGPIAR